MRLSLIGMLACLAALALAAPLGAQAPGAGPEPSPAPERANQLDLPSLTLPASPLPQPADRRVSVPLTITVPPDGAIEVSGDAPPGFPLAELRSRTPGMRITANGDFFPSKIPPRMARLLDALTIVLPRLAEGEIRLAEGGIEVDGQLRPGFSAEATRGAVRLALGSEQVARIMLAEAPPSAALAVTWSRHGAVVSGILPDGLPPSEALPLLREPVEGIVEGGLVDAGVTGGGSGDPAAWREALPRIGHLLPAFNHAVVRMAPGRVSVDGPLEPGHEAERLETWLAAALGEDWEVTVSGTERPAGEGATRHDPVAGRIEQKVGDRWIPLHAFEPDPASCGRHSNAVLAAEPLTFLSGKADLTQGSAETLDALAGIARRCLNQGGLTLEIGGHTDSRGPAEENLALSEARATEVLLELAARGVRADAMRAVGYGETRAIAGNDTEAGRARNRRITFAWSE